MWTQLRTSARLAKIKPTRGLAHALHVALTVLLPVIAYVLVRIDFVSLAILLIVLSKWRMFAVRPRYWLANVIASGVDLMVSIAFVLFMANTSVQWWQLFWMAAFIGWTTFLKPRSDVLSVSAQAMVGQLLGLAVLYLKFGDTPLLILVAGTWLVCYLAARHFLTSFEEPHTALLSHIWAFFSASLAFVLAHWLLFYGIVAQIIVILATIGYSLAALYYLESAERLTLRLKRQLVTIMLAILVIVLVFSDWSGVTI